LRITGAPLAIKDKLIIGASGGDSGVRDWVAGLDAATGNRLHMAGDPERHCGRGLMPSVGRQ
jgi:hypothetical protein